MWGPGEIKIPLPPLRSIDSIIYDAPDGSEGEFTGFRTFGVGDKQGGFILPPIGTWWPYTIREPRAVRIQFTAGFDATPPGVKHAILLMISHWYEHREAVVGILDRSITPAELPLAVDALLRPHRIYS
jgi:hypothetical protein